MDQDQVTGDLRFVRAIVEGADRDRSPAAISFLWAAAGAVGFALMDFRPEWVRAYWSFVGPAGFLASLFLGWRSARRTGQVTAAGGRRYALHFGGMVVTIFPRS